MQMEEGKIDVEDNKSNGETEPKAPTSKLINENAATDAKPLKVFIYIDFFCFLGHSKKDSVST